MLCATNSFRTMYRLVPKLFKCQYRLLQTPDELRCMHQALVLSSESYKASLVKSKNKNMEPEMGIILSLYIFEQGTFTGLYYNEALL